MKASHLEYTPEYSVPILKSINHFSFHVNASIHYFSFCHDLLFETINSHLHCVNIISVIHVIYIHMYRYTIQLIKKLSAIHTKKKIFQQRNDYLNYYLSSSDWNHCIFRTYQATIYILIVRTIMISTEFYQPRRKITLFI